jgi:hypothetical protein
LAHRPRGVAGMCKQKLLELRHKPIVNPSPPVFSRLRRVK